MDKIINYRDRVFDILDDSKTLQIQDEKFLRDMMNKVTFSKLQIKRINKLYEKI